MIWYAIAFAQIEPTDGSAERRYYIDIKGQLARRGTGIGKRESGGRLWRRHRREHVMRILALIAILAWIYGVVFAVHGQLDSKWMQYLSPSSACVLQRLYDAGTPADGFNRRYCGI